MNINIARIEESTKDLFRKLQEADRRKTEIVSNTDYMMWLESFTTIHPKFDDSMFLYGKNGASQLDIDNVSDLQKLYEAVEEYAELNYKYPYPTTGEGIFSDYSFGIKFNGIGYVIGVVHGQGTDCYCSRTDDISDDFIPFENIMNHKKEKNTSEIANNLEYLSDVVMELMARGVPKEAIKGKIDEILKES